MNIIRPKFKLYVSSYCVLLVILLIGVCKGQISHKILMCFGIPLMMFVVFWVVLLIGVLALTISKLKKRGNYTPTKKEYADTVDASLKEVGVDDE